MTDAEVIAAADKLHKIGAHHGWFPVRPHWSDMDPINRDEFRGLVAECLAAAESVRGVP